MEVVRAANSSNKLTEESQRTQEQIEIKSSSHIYNNNINNSEELFV